MRRSVFTFLIALAQVVACGGDDGSSSGGAGGLGGDDPDGAPEEALTCSSLALCTSHAVKRFVGTPGEPAGGSIADGLYVLAWETDPEEEDPGYYTSIEALRVSGDQYVGAGFGLEGLGTVTTSGTTLTLTEKQRCYLGEDGDLDEYSLQYPYTAQADRLILYSEVSSGGVEWLREKVYLRQSADAVCDTVSSEPESPGESAQCKVLNCYCNVAVNGTIDSDTCQ